MPIVITGPERDAPKPEPAKENGFALVMRAAAFAAWKHRDQRRKDAEASPYINHPIALAETLSVEGGVRDPITLAAALLHDTLEDTETSLQELAGAFGRDVAEIVEEVTDVKWLAKTSRKKLQVARSARASSRAKLVKLADKISNVRDVIAHPPSDWSLERKREYFDWAKSVVDGIKGANSRLKAKFNDLYRQRP